MDSKPIVTCHGDQGLFSTVRPYVVEWLPRESVEWKRSYGKPRRLTIEANFVPFNPDILPEEDDWSLPGRPFFHTYWLDSDIETYKATMKEEISDWLMNLRDDNIHDWLIVVIVNDENKVKSKILRTSVYDKVKSDFCNKNADRCVVLSEPLKLDSKSSESWNILLSRMRQLLLQSFNTNISRFEEHMRAERERRTEDGWNFCGYFLLQEELALMFEMLHLYEESLVQYDELDALFTQYVLNHAAGDHADWLNSFISSQNQTWDGLCLSQPIDVVKRQLIKKSKASVLDFRNYLFSRQCALTFLMSHPCDVAQRAIPFMHNCRQELHLLEVVLPPGAFSCWVFICCLEILKQCEVHKTPDITESQYLHTASLWDYARIKLYEVGEICGLIPGLDQEPDRNHIKCLMEGASVRVQKWKTEEEEESEPINKLKEALSSPDAFHKHYLELSELALGTYKFIGRVRSARQIGQDLAEYYMRREEWSKAEGFLQDALKMYRQEGWDRLADHVRLSLAHCYRQLNDKHKLIKIVVMVAGSEFLSADVRAAGQKEMLDLAQEFADDPVLVSTLPVFWIHDISVPPEPYILHKAGSMSIVVKSSLTDAIHCDSIIFSCILTSDSLDTSLSSISLQELRKKKKHRRNASTSSLASVSSAEFYSNVLQSLDVQHRALDLSIHTEAAADSSSLALSAINHHGTLHHIDSSSRYYKERQIVKEDCEFVFEAKNVTLNPGENKVELSGQFPDRGHYSLRQLCIKVARLEFLSYMNQDTVGFDVSCEDPEVTLVPELEPVLAGLIQEVTLQLRTGSFEVVKGSTLQLIYADVLSIEGPDVHGDVITLPAASHKQDVLIPLRIFCRLAENNDGAKSIHHDIGVHCPALSRSFQLELNFSHPFLIKQKLHTSGTKKFIQFSIEGCTAQDIILSDHQLVTESTDVQLLPLNQPHQTMLLNRDSPAAYVWQLSYTSRECPVLPCQFSIQYRTDADSTIRTFHMTYDLSNYMTRLVATVKLSGIEDGATFKVGVPCNMDISIKALDSFTVQDEHQLMYQVHTEPEAWTILGKTSGVFDIGSCVHRQRLEAIPLVAGLVTIPQVTLVKHLCQHDESTTSTDDKSTVRSQFIPFSDGEVYYTSLGLQVQVIPTTNTNPIEISWV